MNFMLVISDVIIRTAKLSSIGEVGVSSKEELAQPIRLSRKAFEIFKSTWAGVSDEHSALLFLESLALNDER